MGKITVLLLVACIFAACSSDDQIKTEKPKETDSYFSPQTPLGKVIVVRYNMRPSPYLGAGYDIMGDYLNIRSVKEAVLDMNKVPEKHIHVFSTRSSFANSFEGINAMEFLKSIMWKGDFVVPIENKDDLLFTKTVSDSEWLGDSYGYSSQYQFSCEQMIFTDIRQSINALQIPFLLPYLSDEFVRALKSFSVDELVETFGTHVIINANLGFRIKNSYKAVIADNYEGSMALSYGSRSRAATIYKTKNSGTSPEKEIAKNNGGSIKVVFNGGDPRTLPPLILSPNEVLGNPMDIEKWIASYDGSNYALTTLKSDDVLPIYDFITDPLKRQQVKEAVSAHIKANQISMLKTVPLFQAWNGNAHRYFTSYKELINSGCECKGAIGTLFVEPQPDMVPLYCYTNGENDRLSIEYPITVEGMKYVGIIGYVNEKYTSNIFDEIYEIWNGKEYAYTTEDEKSYGEKDSWTKTGKTFFIRKI